jgi:hypothetical protein
MLGVGSEPVWQLKRGETLYRRISDRELLLLVELEHLKPSDLLWKPGLGGWKSPEALSGVLTTPHRPSGRSIIAQAYAVQIKCFAGCGVEGCHPLAGQGQFDRETSCSVLKLLVAAQLSALGEEIRIGQPPPSHTAGSGKLVRTANRAGVCGFYRRRRPGLLRNRRPNSNRNKATGPPNRSACARYGEARENFQFLRNAARNRTSSDAISR